MSAVVSIMDRVALKVGKYVRSQWETVIGFYRFMVELLITCPQIVRNFHLTVEQMFNIGVTSIPLIITTSAFTGAVVSWQMAYQFADMIPLTYVGMAVGKAVMLELGPILTGMVMAGRIGAALSSELGTMAVTEQLDAMKCLGLDPFRFLLAPRLMGTMLIMPVLTVVSMSVALAGGYFVAHFGKDVTFDTFFFGVRLFYTNWDLVVGLIKSLTFGFLIASFACFFGYYTRNGAEGVGKSTKATVVASMTWILVSTTFLSKFLLV